MALALKDNYSDMEDADNNDIHEYRKKAKSRLRDESDAFRELYDVLDDKKREVKYAR